MNSMGEALKKAGFQGGPPPGAGGQPKQNSPQPTEKNAMSFFEPGKPGVIREALLTDEAERIAGRFVGKNLREPDLSSAQLRKFYGEVKALQAKIEAHSKEEFEKYRPLVKMMKAKVAYASNSKKQGRVPDEFKNFIDRCVGAIQTVEDFKAFALHFEAVVGFYYGKGVRQS